MRVKSKVLPLASLGLGSAGIRSLGRLSDEDIFSEKSGRAMLSDGTKAAKSGGWSFPTLGLAYKRSLISITLSYKYSQIKGRKPQILITSKSTYMGSLPTDMRYLSRSLA